MKLQEVPETPTGSFLTSVRGFTPVIDALVQEVGLIPAVVYGVVWRYCQMRDRVCRASLQTIAAHIGLNRKTIERHIKALCNAGYLRDTTPDVRHKPHIYVDTGKEGIMGLVMTIGGKTESLTSGKGEVRHKVLPGQTQSPTRSDTESYPAQTQSPTRSDTKSYLGKTESPIKKESKIVESEENKETFSKTAIAASTAGSSSTSHDPPEDRESELLQSAALDNLVDECSREFADTQHLEQNASQLFNVWAASTLDEAAMLSAVRQARDVTRQRLRGGGVKKAMPYFFATLRDRVNGQSSASG